MNFNITRRAAALVLLDIALCFAAYISASYLTNVEDFMFHDNEIYFALGILAIINICVFTLFRLYNSLWEYASIHEVIKIVAAVGLASLIGATFLWLIGMRLPIRVYVVSFVLLMIFSGGTRLGFRIFKRHKHSIFADTKNIYRPRTLVVGAGETGSLAIGRMLNKDPLMAGVPIIAIDDQKSKIGHRIHGVQVVGRTENIKELVQRYQIEQIIVAIPSASTSQRKRIYEQCTQTDCILKTLPNIRDLRIDEIGDIALRDVDLSDLLGREEVLLDSRLVSGFIAGKTILVTGGGGSIGSELVRQISIIAPAKIVVFDIYENDAYMISHEILEKYNDIDCIVEIGSICDAARVNEIFNKHKPSVVFHAAAHKHVPLMEVCPREAMQNNILGTLNVVQAADRCKTDRFIFISTDKAVNPTSVMGATKRAGEMVVQYFAKSSKTCFSAVRFGNVLGSNGSVIPVFKRQIAAGGPVTVTHKDIERFFMTIPEASRLVIQAGGLAKGGEIFILDMGEPVKIDSLARSLIRLSGNVVGQDIKIEYIGLRDGEKMYEELLMDEESTIATPNKSIMISVGQEISYNEFEGVLAKIKDVIYKTDAESIRVLEDVVKTYTYTHH